MKQEDVERMADATGPSQAEPEDVSALRASVPCAWRAIDSAPKGQRILVMCSGSAPWPVMVARWDGESWVSKDEATQGKKWDVLGWQPLPDPAPLHHRCSFCAKDVSEVERLIAGPRAVMICNECVLICDEIMAEAAQGIEAGTAKTEGLGPQDESPVGAADAPKPYRAIEKE